MRLSPAAVPGVQRHLVELETSLNKAVMQAVTEASESVTKERNLRQEAEARATALRRRCHRQEDVSADLERSKRNMTLRFEEEREKKRRLEDQMAAERLKVSKACEADRRNLSLLQRKLAEKTREADEAAAKAKETVEVALPLDVSGRPDVAEADGAARRKSGVPAAAKSKSRSSAVMVKVEPLQRVKVEVSDELHNFPEGCVIVIDGLDEPAAPVADGSCSEAAAKEDDADFGS